MPQGGVPSRSARRSVTPWWEELEREAFRFPAPYRESSARSRRRSETARSGPRAPREGSPEREPGVWQEVPIARASRSASAAPQAMLSAGDPATPAVGGAAGSVAEAHLLAVDAVARTVAGAPSPTTGGAVTVAGGPSPAPVAALGAVAEAPAPVTASLAGATSARRADHRTVTDGSGGTPRDLPARVRRPAVPRHERPDFRPDRIAMWAVVLGLFLVFVTVVSAHAAVTVHQVTAHHLAGHALRAIQAR
jgi:hypothetical protein